MVHFPRSVKLLCLPNSNSILFPLWETSSLCNGREGHEKDEILKGRDNKSEIKQFSTSVFDTFVSFIIS